MKENTTKSVCERERVCMCERECESEKNAAKRERYRVEKGKRGVR